MTSMVSLYDRFAKLFAYPTGDYGETLMTVTSLMDERCPTAATRLRQFSEEIGDMELHDLEESFTRTFDLNPAACAEVGWHLFGERYDRGSFMVWMREQLRRQGVTETHELPDHLVHVLPVLGRMEAEEQQRFATQAVEPALAVMITKVTEESNPFRHLIQAAQDFLISVHGEPAWKIDETQMQNHEGFQLPVGSKE